MKFLSTDIRLRARFSQAGGIHRILPRAVARPESEDQLLQVLQWSKDNGVSVTARGAGSAMGGGSVGEGLVLDLSGYAPGLPQVDPEARVAEVSASNTLGELDAAAAKHGLRFGPDPSSSPWASVGGVIGTNAAGPRSYSLGSVDRWVESLEILTFDGPLDLSRGERAEPSDHPVLERFLIADELLSRHRAPVMERWPKTKKNTAGYGLGRYWSSGDLLDLVVGSEGTLGVVCSARLRLQPVPACRGSLRVTLDSRGAIAAAVEAIRDLTPVAVELLDGSLLGLIQGRLSKQGLRRLSNAAAVLLVDFEGDHQEGLSQRLNEAAEALSGVAVAVEVAEDAAGSASLWAIRHAASPMLAAMGDRRRSLQVIEDGCVPLARLAEYLDGIQGCADAVGIPVVMFGHAGDGHVHVNLLPNLTQDGWLERVSIIFDEVTRLVITLGGTPAGEHGAGRLRAATLGSVLGPEALECFRAIKDAFDSEGLFNPGVIIPDGHPPLGRLKVGPDSARLPTGISSELSRVESERGWSENRWFAGDRVPDAV